MKHRYFPILFAALLGVVFSGCTSLQPKIDSATMSMKASLNMIPIAQCTAFWDAAVRQDPSLAQPERGFAGRVYFYGEDTRYPLKVNDGHVVVYAFDEEGRAADDNAPDRSYVFDMEDLSKLYRKSKLGHSYNLWIPWDTAGQDGDAKRMSLIVKHVPHKGASTVSSQAKVFIPGRKGDRMLASKADWDAMQKYEGDVRQVAHFSHTGESGSGRGVRAAERRTEAKIIERANRPERMQTTTFDLARSLPNAAAMPTSTTLAPPQPLPQRLSATPVNGSYGYAYAPSPPGNMVADGTVPPTYLPMSYFQGMPPVPQQSGTVPPQQSGFTDLAPRAGAGPMGGMGMVPSSVPPATGYYPGPTTPSAPSHYSSPSALPVPRGQAAPTGAVLSAYEPPQRDSRSTPLHGVPARR